MKKLVCELMVFVLLNILVLGFMQVYKVSYNTMNSEHIQMVGISTDKKGSTELKVLDKSFHIDISPYEIMENSDLKYTLFAICSTDVKNIMKIIEYVGKILY